MKTTIELPDDLYHRLETRAAADGLEPRDLIARLLDAGLRAGPAPAAPTNGAAPRRRSEFPVIRQATGRPLPALTNAEIEEILLAEDVERLKAGRD